MLDHGANLLFEVFRRLEQAFVGGGDVRVRHKRAHAKLVVHCW